MTAIEFNYEITRTYDALKGFAVKLTKNQTDAEDLVQETVYKALKNKSKYSNNNFRAWIYTIMRNIFINEYNKKVKQKTVFDSSENQYTLNNLYKTNNNPETFIAVKEIWGKVKEVSEDFRAPLNLFIEGYKYKEIAEKLNIPIGTVKSRIHTAKATMNKKLANV